MENKSLDSNQSHQNGDDILFNEVALVCARVYLYDIARIRIDHTHTQKTFQLFRKCLLIFDIWYESNSLIVRMP